MPTYETEFTATSSDSTRITASPRTKRCEMYFSSFATPVNQRKTFRFPAWWTGALQKKLRKSCLGKSRDRVRARERGFRISTRTRNHEEASLERYRITRKSRAI